MIETWNRIDSRTQELDGKLLRVPMVADRPCLGRLLNGSPVAERCGDGLTNSDTCKRHLVLVEDSDDDAFLFELGARRSGLNLQIHRARSVPEARVLLAGNRPSLVTLDCNLPGECGLDLLREIRALESYRAVPVVMMSGSESGRDVSAAYANGANSFLKKPFDYHEYVNSVSMLLAYWLEMNCPPVVPEAVPACVWLG